MKAAYFFLAIVVSLLVVFPGYAGAVQPGPAYISDSIKITMRTGQGMDNKIVALLTVGQAIEVLEPGDEWSLIRAANGKEGWILSSFISTTPPNSMVLKEVEARMAALSEQCAGLEAENARLASENAALKESLASESSEMREQVETLTRENRLLRDSLGHRFIKWFLAGAGVLVAGFFMGYQSRRERNRLY
ncbi:MAG: TIGR04211 family SH3 domain-containing protein [Thermodesulfobacteriota bacterium]|nr:TIGR04211 family SH3 domain-containing protein [Thermodesulfobacteriota bacterium]